VNILGENDEKPVCTPNSYFLAIPVDLKVGTNIQNFKLTCTDLDSSPRSFRYSIGPGNVFGFISFRPGSEDLEQSREDTGLCAHRLS
jgi:cadherin-related family protein 3